MYLPANLTPFMEPVRKYLDEAQLHAPVIAGGVGGSGTRLVVQMLQRLGFSMGQHLNGAGDALHFIPVYDNHIAKCIAGNVSPRGFVDDLLVALVAHRGGSGEKCAWGWKNPRSIYLLPLLDQLFDGMRFVHVVRDGHTVATSRNQAQLEKYGTLIIPHEYQHLPKADKSLLLWSYVNTAAADYGNHMGMRYLCLRYEDICENPVKAMGDLALALGVEQPQPSIVIVNTPRTRDLQRHSQRAQSAAAITDIALQRFGYPC